MASFCNKTSQQIWESVLKTDDVNQAYDSFLHIFMDIFKKHCSVKQIPHKSFENTKPGSPTNGLKRVSIHCNEICRSRTQIENVQK